MRSVHLAPRLCQSLALLVCWSCCSTHAEQFGRDHVGLQLERRTGLSIGPGDDSVPPGVQVADGIDEREAVLLALWHNAAFQEALAELGLRRADLIQAGEIANPSFMVLFPLGPKQLEFAARFPFDFLWQRPQRVAAAQFDCERVSALLVQGGLDLVRDVHVAFAELGLAVERAAFLGERERVRAQVAASVAARANAGDASRAEVQNARVDAMRAGADRARAEQDRAVATERIRALLGASVTPATPIDTPPPAAVGATVVDDSLPLASALAQRPDLRSADMGVEAAAERAGLASAEILSLTGIADANGSGSHFEMGPGLDLKLPLLNQNQASRVRASVELQRALWHRQAVHDRVVLDVREAQARQRAARDVLVREAEVLALLEAADRHAARSHAAGDQPVLVSLEARLRLLDGRLRDAEARAEVRRATAQLQRSVGGRLP